MPVIHPHGLFNGQRLGACSDRAQDRWHRYFSATNSYGRIEFDAEAIRQNCFRYYKHGPTVEEILEDFKEYVANYLAIPYRANGHLWFQFVTEKRFLPEYKPQSDRSSPEPSEAILAAFDKGYAEWKQEREKQSSNDSPEVFQMFSQYSENVQQTSAEHFPLERGRERGRGRERERGRRRGSGIGIGDGDGVGISLSTGVDKTEKNSLSPKQKSSSSSSVPSLPKTKKQKQQQPQDVLAQVRRGLQIARALATPPRKASRHAN
jgi:hypothetical protein